MDGIEKRMRVMADPGNSLQPSYGLTRLESDSSCVYTHSVSKLLFCGHLTPGEPGFSIRLLNCFPSFGSFYWRNQYRIR